MPLLDLSLIGDHAMVPLVTGASVPYINLDYAASTPALVSVLRAVTELLPTYSSVHRGSGYKSQVTTAAYERARAQVGAFVGARDDDCVIFTANTTHAINLLAAALPADARVLYWASEHHADLLPWRQLGCRALPVPVHPDQVCEQLETVLSSTCVDLVAVTGASNVTGEIWPYEQITKIAHAYGARVLLDAAQLAPHRTIDLTASDVDWVAISGHKLYAPFGAGALVGRRHWLEVAPPLLAGGGTVRYVGPDEVIWSALPDRQEAGSPNVIGAVALAAACTALTPGVLTAAAEHETKLYYQLEEGLSELPGVTQYRCWPARSCPRIGVTCWTADTVPYARLAAVLSAEHGIGVRHGCFCAHPLMAHLLGIDPDTARGIAAARMSGTPHWIPGAVRASMGLGVTAADINVLLDAMVVITRGGVSWTYTGTADGTDCWPDPDPRG